VPERFARWDRLAARASHWLLYLILIGMPVSGYLMNATDGYPIGFFWLFEVPGLPKTQGLSDFAFRFHVVIGQWFVYALVILHVAATAWHVAVKKGGVGASMGCAVRLSLFGRIGSLTMIVLP
jgi:cytochrome b561